MFLYFFKVLTTFILTSTLAYPFESSNDNNELTSNFDYFTLSQQWYLTNCWNRRNLWEEKTCTQCKMPESTDNWTIHGLWPSRKSTVHPNYCNNKIKYEAGILNSFLEKLMEEKWPTAKLESSHNFWAYEWNKHGTCCLNFEATNTMEKYFKLSLSLLEQYNMGRTLLENGILPGSNYKIDDIYRAVKNTLGVTAKVLCELNPRSNMTYVSEIHIHFDKSLQLIDSPEIDQSNCGKGMIAYPKVLKSC